MQVEKESHLHHELRAKSFVQSRGWKIGKIYRLEAMSGKSIMNYPETKRMLHDIKSGAITGLVFSKIARLARNTKELIEISEIFQEYGADLISMDMSIDTSTSIGRHFFRQMSSMAEWEREMIAERISASVRTRAELGKHIGGQAPFGYRYVDKRLEPDPKEAPILKLMFELFLKYKRKKTVATALNEQGFRTKRGNKFTDSTVKRLLKNPVAKGVQVMNTRYSNTSKPNQKKPKEEWIFHEVEPIVHEDLWEEVNKIIDSQQKSHKQVLNTKVHLFTGFIHCHCGSRMYTRYNSENYVCHSSCGNRIRKDDLEEIFRSELHSYTVSEKRVKEYFKKLKSSVRDKKKQLASLKEDKRKLTLHLEQILLLHTEGKIATEAFDTYHQKPYEQLQQIEQSIHELENDVTLNQKTEDSTSEILSQAKNLFAEWNTFNDNQKREIIETITDKIIVGEKEIDIRLFKLLPEYQTPLPMNCEQMGNTSNIE
tara:strand:- start:2623 stop:4074 length:1452 start_codon:yes stop_codon:yes gene_type:complete